MIALRACGAQFTLAARKDPLSRVDCDGLAAGVGLFVGQSSAIQRMHVTLLPRMARW
jgi:hypothetical protein